MLRVQGSGCGAWGVECSFGGQGLGFGVWGLCVGFGIECLGFRGKGLEFGVWGVGLQQGQGFRFRV